MKDIRPDRIEISAMADDVLIGLTSLDTILQRHDLTDAKQTLLVSSERREDIGSEDNRYTCIYCLFEVE